MMHLAASRIFVFGISCVVTEESEEFANDSKHGEHGEMRT